MFMPNYQVKIITQTPVFKECDFWGCEQYCQPNVGLKRHPDPRNKPNCYIVDNGCRAKWYVESIVVTKGEDVAAFLAIQLGCGLLSIFHPTSVLANGAVYGCHGLFMSMYRGYI